jgi:hypothetical protein
MAQIWRDSNNVVVGSMSATGVMSAVKFIGDGSALSGLTGVGDNLGSHVATTTLNMGGQSIVNAASATFNNSVTVYSSATIVASDALSASLWASTSTVTPHLYVSTGGNVGLGTASPSAKLQVDGTADTGGYVMILNSGSKVAAWLRNK